LRPLCFSLAELQNHTNKHLRIGWVQFRCPEHTV
jgi:hypothetical protein